MITIAEENYWPAVLARDAQADGLFVYAVRSTGIYCRPSCPSRRPRPEQVAFYASPAAAEQAGFRACRRCRPGQSRAPDQQVEMVQQACAYIEAHLSESLTLAALGAHFGVSPYHLQRMFKRVTGVSPRRYSDARRLDCFKEQLRQGGAVTEALYEVGYGSSSRLYERAPAQLGMTPVIYRRGGWDTQICYTIVDCPLGRLLLAATERGICAVAMDGSDDVLETNLVAEYPSAAIRRDDASLAQWAALIVRHLRGDLPHLDLPLDVRATAFQARVWEALRAIPYGATRTYGEIAAAIGAPGAARAVGRACATNPASLVIPCHRAVGGDGALHGYRWGLERKRALLEQERTEG